MHNQIIAFLKTRQGCCSSEELSAASGVSGQQLWESIQELRREGYDIIAVPHRGYQLVASPDRLYPVEIQSGLQTEIFGRRIVYLEDTLSVMDQALSLGLSGAEEGTLVVAEAQSEGRGRMGRPWSSPRYRGIYACLLARPEPGCDNLAVLTLATAVSICQAVRGQAQVSCRIKWPNDIIAGQGKLGGILTEMKAEKERAAFAAIGFGINVNTPDEELVEGAVSLRGLTGQAHDRSRLLRQILHCFESEYALFRDGRSAEIVQRGRELSATLGKRVSVDLARGSVNGEAVDLDGDGGLLIRRESGIVEKIFSGDVLHCR